MVLYYFKTSNFLFIKLKGAFEGKSPQGFLSA